MCAKLLTLPNPLAENRWCPQFSGQAKPNDSRIIEKCYTDPNGMPAWGRFTFHNRGEKEIEDFLFEQYFKLISAIALHLQQHKQERGA